MGQTGSRNEDSTHFYYTDVERVNYIKSWTSTQKKLATKSRADVATADCAINMVRELVQGRMKNGLKSIMFGDIPDALVTQKLIDVYAVKGLVWLPNYDRFRRCELPCSILLDTI